MLMMRGSDDCDAIAMVATPLQITGMQLNQVATFRPTMPSVCKRG